ncbi:flagellar hook-associated protein FlgL [Amnibacterium endophyticum]|uniref:Flagellar hook-associated protein FlgL n=1 Tax=Amnibacterium endophyticum TaxID=2109337 RepID=A0ABW4LJL0_9MICO
MTTIGRVTSQQLYLNSQTAMAQSKARLSTLQQQSSSGIAVAKASDDPVAAGTILRLQSSIANNSQYASNITDGLGWLSTADSALSTSEDLVRKASDLTIQAANSATSSPEVRSAIAAQLTSLRSELLGQANTQYLGRSVFAGSSDAPAAFSADGTFNGVVQGTTTVLPAAQRRISSTETIPVSGNGAAAFGTPSVAGPPAVAGTSVFESIDRVITALQSPDYDTGTADKAAITAGIDDLKSAMSRMTTEHAVIGNAYSRIQDAKTRVGDQSTLLEQQRSDVQDIDTTKVLLDLKTQELAYQTSLAVTAQVLQPTLMSFLR